MESLWTTAEASDRPVVLVIGATRAPGRSVVRHLLRRGRFDVRVMVKNPGGLAGDRLRALGVEVVAGDLGDRESLQAAMRYVHGVYGVLDLWEYFEGDYAHGVNLADAVSESGVDHFVFSTLPPVGELARTELNVRPSDLTRRIEAYVRGLALPATFLHVAYYFDDFLGVFLPRPHPDGSFRVRLPHRGATLAGVAAEDIGGVAAAIFERPTQLIGRTVRVVGDERAPACYVHALSAATGRAIGLEAGYDEPALAPVAQRVADALEYYDPRGGDRAVDLMRSRELYPEIQGFESWLDRHRERVQAALRR